MDSLKSFSTIMASIFLVVSLVVMVGKLFAPQPIQIILQSGQEITTQNSDYFTMTEVLLLIVCSFVIGTSTTYLFFSSDRDIFKRSEKSEGRRSYESLFPLLKENEKRVVKALEESKGEMLQNRLVLRMGISKVKVTRTIAGLEKKGIVVKERSGLTNSIRLR